MYLPKSQISENLYTNGGELTKKSTGENYIGAYWKTSSNKYFSGKTPDDLVVEELVLKVETGEENLTSEAYSYLGQVGTEFKKYQALNNSFSTPLIIPSSFNPKPSTEDYEAGEFTRFFAKKTNEISYIEISESTYNKLITRDPSYLFQMYLPFKYNWKLTGKKEDVYLTNKKVTKYMSTTFNLPLLSKFLKEDFLKFYI